MVIVAILGYVLPAVKFWGMGKLGVLRVCRPTCGWLLQRGVSRRGGGGRHARCPVLQDVLAGEWRVVQSTLLHKAQAIQSHPHISCTKHKQHNLILTNPAQSTSNTISLTLLNKGQPTPSHSVSEDKQCNIILLFPALYP